MHRILNKALLSLPLALLLLSNPIAVQAQEDDEAYYLRLLQTEVEVENPVYKPVLSFGTGVLHFMGDVRTTNNPLVGDWGYRVAVSTFIGKQNFFRLNFFVLYGHLTGHDFDISRSMQLDRTKLPVDRNRDNQPIFINSSFRSEVWEFGVSMEYAFGHLIGNTKRFKPFVSLGFSPLLFTPMGNIYNTYPNNYYFWDDGYMRDVPPPPDPLSWNPSIVRFNDEWDRNLSRSEYHGIEPYNETSFAIPLEVGFDFYLSYRVNLRVASGIHYALTDLLDNFDRTAADYYGRPDLSNGRHDMFMFTNVSLNLDLFSDPRFYIIEREFAEIEYFDYDIMFADQDMDGVFDRLDMCPDTPIGVEVDSVGCPLDSDGDGVPDYLDLEPNTPSGAVVDDRGRQLTPERLAEMYEVRGEVVYRRDAQTIPIPPSWSRRIEVIPGQVPQKFKHVDLDGDGYISFSELLREVERFFNQESNLTLEDMYDLNNYFFSQ